MKIHGKITALCLTLALVVNSSFALISNPLATWKFQTNGPVRGGFVSDGDALYFGSSDGNVYSINKANGLLKWKFATGGAITNSVALSANVVVISSRDNIIYGVNPKTGQQLWKYQTQAPAKFEMEWDYHSSSPVISGRTVYVGAADGYVYALSLDQGKLIWKFKTNARVRATPLVDNGTVYAPSLDGFLYVLGAAKGDLLWKYETRGATYDGKKFGFDRTSIYSSPRLIDSLLVFGSRDGSTYCVNVKTHKKKWNFFIDGTWAASEPVIENGVVYIGWSTNYNFTAIDLHTGKEKWKFVAKGVLYGTPALEGKRIYTASADHNLYCLDNESGKVVWTYKASNSMYSSPLVENDNIYIADENGTITCLREGEKAFRAVYHPVPRNKSYESAYTVEAKLTPYFKEQGFEHLDSAKLYHFLTARINDKKPSVIVFPYQYIPENIVGENPAEGLIRKYLEEGGKILWFGDVPKRFVANEKGQFYKVDNTIAQPMLDVIVDHEMESGNYYSTSTQEGLNWGLPVSHTVTYATVSPDGVEVLAYNEFNRPAVWVKKFTDRPGAGFVSYRPWAWFVPFPEECLPILKAVALYGLE